MLRSVRPILLLVLLASAGLTAAPVRIGVERHAPPLAYTDASGQPTGFTVELLRAMARTGVEIEIVPGYWAQHIREFDRGRLDGFANTLPTEANVAALDLTVGHAQLHGVVYQRRDRPRIRRAADFAGKTIATLSGTAANANALNRGAWGARIRTFTDWQAAFDATFRGECDATFLTNRPTSFIANDHGLRRDLIDDIVYRFHIGVRKGDAATLAKLNAALATVMRNGTFDDIYARWIGPIEPRRLRLQDLRPYLVPVAAILTAIIALIAWQRHMMGRLARQAEAIRASEERWKFALEGSGAAVWDLNIAGQTMHYSPEWKRLFGFAENEIGTDPKDVTRVVHPDDQAKLNAAIEAHWQDQNVPFAIEHRARCKDGAVKWILNRGMVVRRAADGKPLRMIGTCTDLTHLRQAEEHRLIQGKLESTGVLAGGIAHDFNNLLASMVLNLDLASWPDASREDINRHLVDIRKAALAANHLTQQLITFAKGGVSTPRPTDLRRLVTDAVEVALSGSACRSDAQFSTDLWPANVDPAQIGQVIRNLVLNAREAMPGGGVVFVRAENRQLEDHSVPELLAGRYVEITVTDTGEGIPADRLATIFDPYFSTKRRGTDKGMGLGLTIALSIVKKHGGMIMVRSAPGMGSTFSVYLPASTQEVAPVPARLKTPAGVRVLVMDDEETVRNAVAGAARQLGYSVDTVVNGAEAVQSYRRAQEDGAGYGAVILDLTVRGAMGGLEALTHLRALDPAVTAIVMSGYTDDDVVRDYGRYGFKGALTKPFQLSGLRQVLAAALERP